MRNAHYLKHDLDARHDAKLKALRRSMGSAGYGLFWLITEDLRLNNGRLSRDYEAIAWDLNETVENVRAVVEQFDLFYFDGDSIASYRIDKEVEEQIGASERASAAGRASAMQREKQQAFNGRSTGVQHPLVVRSTDAQPKEKKREEKKREEKTIEAAEAPYEPKTPNQRLVCAYKIAKGVPFDDREWDKANFTRYAKAAASLLKAFDGQEREAAEFIMADGKELDSKALTWTLETVTRRAWDSKGQRQAQAPPRPPPALIGHDGQEEELITAEEVFDG